MQSTVRKGLAVSCIGVLGLLGSLVPFFSGSASAGISYLEHAYAPIQYHNGDCGENIGEPGIGSVSYQRFDLSTTMDVTITDGTPNTNYYETLWNAAPCEQLDYLGVLRTNSEGRASAVYSVNVPVGDSWLFETGQANCEYNDTLSVYLPGNV